MGKGTDGVKTSPEELEQEVREIREDLSPVLEELDHRRHEATDLKLQLRRRGPAILRVVAIAAAVFVGFKYLKRRRTKARARRPQFAS